MDRKHFFLTAAAAVGTVIIGQEVYAYMDWLAGNGRVYGAVDVWANTTRVSGFESSGLLWNSARQTWEQSDTVPIIHYDVMRTLRGHIEMKRTHVVVQQSSKAT